MIDIHVGPSEEWIGESDGSQPPSRPFQNDNRVSCNKQSNYYAKFKNKLFTSSHRESIIDLRRRAERERTLDDITLLHAVKANYPFVYRINDGVGTTNTILQKVCEERGWREFQERHSGTPYEKAMKGATGWNLWWSYSVYQFSPYKYLRHWQFTNHNPKGFQFCNKLYLTTYLRKMKQIHGSIFDFYPTSYIIPDDYIRLSIEHSNRTESFSLYNHNNMLVNLNLARPCTENNIYTKKRPKTATSQSNTRLRCATSPKYLTQPATAPPDFHFIPVWISKPIGQSQGKGIFLTTDIGSIATDKKSVIQEYICRPLLIGGYKWDIRIYVCVAAIDPLVIYIYQDGLCRFATEKYNTSDLAAMYSHLTNASLNKLSPGYEEDKELIGPGCKWSLYKLREYFREHNISDWLMWQKIMVMVVLTVIGDSLRLGYSSSNKNCFDLFGFDVLIDEDLKPWLLECNYSPGLGGDCETDEVVKKPMLHALFDLLGFPDKSTNESGIDDESMEQPFAYGDEVGGPYRDYVVDATRQYIEMLLEKIGPVDSGESRHKDILKSSYAYSSAARLIDAKSIYSQNLVVQYLRNQSQGKLSKQVKEQIIALASKKLRKQAAADKKTKSTPPTAAEDSSTTDHCQQQTEVETNSNIRKREALSPPADEKPKTVVIRKIPEFPHPESEAFHKLKNYFDAGVDYPVDIKTGKFTECPALVTIKKDWFNPPKQQGQWIRVYPFDARTTKSPYKSSLTDLRQAVRSLDTYMKVAEQLFMTKPYESDEYFRKKLKTLCRRENEIWTPPSPPSRSEETIVTESSSTRLDSS